jgi:hypothetical protein
MSGVSERVRRAAANQALFRAVNEQMRRLNDAISELTSTFVIACECADTRCVERIEVSPEDYLRVRESPRRFLVLPGHVFPEVEDVVAENGGHVVVEKHADATAVAENLR